MARAAKKEATKEGGTALKPGTVDALEEITGFRFTDVARLERALTHASAKARGGKDYQRLEFLGDRVLGLCISEMLFARFPDANEGELSVRLNALVNADTLATIAEEIGLPRFIRIGTDVGDLLSERQKNTRADVVESLIAALYLEGGFDVVRAFIKRYWEPMADQDVAPRRDPKTELQEWAHKKFGAPPTYRELSREGPDHEPVFTVEVRVGSKRASTASARSKRLAEQAAAEQFLYREGIWKGGETPNKRI